jgi:Zn-dependent protease
VAIRVSTGPPRENPLVQLLSLGIQLNVLLAVFNLVPLPPLDGSHVVEWALPNGTGHRYVRAITPYGGFILLALVMSGALFTVLSPLLDLVVGLLHSLVR